MPVRIFPLTDRAAAAPFAAMTYPHHVPDLLSVEPGGPVVAVAAEDDRPCGLALAKLTRTSADLVSVLVRADARRTGVGTALVAAAEARLRELGAKSVAGNFPLGTAATPAVERLLAGCGWDAPRPRMGLFKMGPGVPAAFRAHPWVRAELPAGFEVVPWLDLPEAERAAVSEMVKSDPAIPRFVDPAAYPGDIHPRYSLALRSGGRVVGWSIIHRVGDAVIRVAILFADKRVVPPGVGLVFLGRTARAVAEDADAGRPLTSTWVIEADNPFIRVCEGRMLRGVPHTLTRTARSEKRFA